MPLPSSICLRMGSRVACRTSCVGSRSSVGSLLYLGLHRARTELEVHRHLALIVAGLRDGQPSRVGPLRVRAPLHPAGGLVHAVVAVVLEGLVVGTPAPKPHALALLGLGVGDRWEVMGQVADLREEGEYLVGRGVDGHGLLVLFQPPCSFLWAVLAMLATVPTRARLNVPDAIAEPWSRV